MLRTLFIAATAVVALLALTAIASADHSWGNYHWARTSNPFTLQLENDLTTAEWNIHLGNVSTDWSKSNVLDTTIVNDTATSKACKPIAGKIRVCNRTYGFNGWLGLAQIWVTNGHITQGVAKVNDSYFNTGTYNNANAKRHVLCQEVGHDFGLDHQHGVSDSCMNDEGNTLSLASAVSPNQHDYDQLATIYAHTDSSSTISAPASAGAGPQVSVRDLGDGRLLITIVIPAR